MASSKDFTDVLGPDSSQGVSSTPAPDVIRVASGAGKETAIAGEAYEGASRFSRELALWQPGNRTADQDILPAKRLSDARIRNILQNDAYAQNGQRLHQDNIVGSQFLLNAKPNSQVLMGKLDEKWEEEFQEEVEEKFGLWAESDANYIDSTRRNSFTMLVRQAVGTYLMCGEVLAAVDWDRSSKSDRPFSTSIRMIDVDRLSTPMDKLSNAFIIGGVEVNQDHVPTHYHIRKANPRDVYLAQAYQWERLWRNSGGVVLSSSICSSRCVRTRPEACPTWLPAFAKRTWLASSATWRFRTPWFRRHMPLSWNPICLRRISSLA